VSAATEVSLDEVRAAHQRIRAWIRRTPLLTSERLDSENGASLYFKCEGLQEVGAFKARGASNALLSLAPPALPAGVVTHSSGNHGAAVAWAARRRGVAARIVMPRNSSKAKLEAVRSYGGEVVLCEPTQRAREAAAAELVRRTGAEFIHPYDDPRVIAGQGTLALELLEQQPRLDVLLLPVGGGGLASGVAVAVKALSPDTQVIGVEPEGADDARRSFASGVLTTLSHPDTQADGLRAALSERTFALMRRYVDEVVTVPEASLVPAMRALWRSLHVLVEISSAVPYAAVLERRVQLAGKHVAIILTGANVDLDALPWIAATTPAAASAGSR
jgi:threonine dehydratase